MRALTRGVLIGFVVLGAVAFGGTGGARAKATTPKEPAFGPERTRVDHREVDVTFRSHGTSLAGTLFLPKTGEPHPAVVWVHASGEHERLGYGELVSAAIRANLAFSRTTNAVSASRAASVVPRMTVRPGSASLASRPTMRWPRSRPSGPAPT